MTDKFWNSVKIITVFCLFLIVFPENYQAAYTDLSTYRIETGKFVDESKAKTALEQLQKDTGWTGLYKSTNDYQEYYQIISGGFSGESKVKQVLQQFEKATGIEGNYVGIGELQNYYQVISGGFQGESKVKQVLQQFETTTGINANYEEIGERQTYYQIISGGFPGESRVKQVLRQFEKATGMKAEYIGVGKPQNYYQIISGGFSGELRVKQVLQQFQKTTGIKANYVPLGNNRYQIKSEPVLGLSEVKRGQDFFKKNKWWVTSRSTGKRGFEIYRIKSEPVLGQQQVNKGRDFFKRNKWWVTYKSTGQKGYESYRIKSEPVLGLDAVNKGRDFFKRNKWWVTYSSTGQKGYERYKIKSEPVLGAETVKKGRDFFKRKNWVATAQSTGKVQNYYQIVTQEFDGYDNAKAAIQKITGLYGWMATPVKTKNGPQLMYTDYGLSLNSMLDKQMSLNPQTDKYRNEPRYVYAAYVNIDKQIITADNVNLRSAPSTTGEVVQQLNSGDGVMVIGKTGDWVEVRLTWQKAKAPDLDYYLNPNNFSLGNKDYFQFLKLSQPANLRANEVNEKILNGRGILAGKGQAFIDAANKYNVNEVYLISHSLLETGNGSSNLANGVMYNGKKVYNLYGYGAYDSCPLTCGAQTAYENGWFTPEAAIIGGAQFISGGYIYNDTFQQDTLYKMRWNPVQPWHQYASDIGWAYKQVNNIYNLYQSLDNYILYYDIPKYQ